MSKQYFSNADILIITDKLRKRGLIGKRQFPEVLDALFDITTEDSVSADFEDVLRAYLKSRREQLKESCADYAVKQSNSGNMGDFGTYRWLQGRLAEVDTLLNHMVRAEREVENGI